MTEPLSPEALERIHDEIEGSAVEFESRDLPHNQSGLTLAQISRELYAELARVTAERDRFREHSITLNSVSWKLAEALGDAVPGAGPVEVNPLDQVARVAAKLNETYAVQWSVIEAAKVWRTCRRGPMSGGVFHRSCSALDDAVAAMIGELHRPPVPPPSAEELERGRALVVQATEFGERANRARADRLDAAADDAP